jgi:hypothetical protein
MIKTKEMSKEFWAETVRSEVYIQNRYPYVFLNNRTPKNSEVATNPMLHISRYSGA